MGMDKRESSIKKFKRSFLIKTVITIALTAVVVAKADFGGTWVAIVFGMSVSAAMATGTDLGQWLMADAVSRYIDEKTRVRAMTTKPTESASGDDE